MSGEDGKSTGLGVRSSEIVGGGSSAMASGVNSGLNSALSSAGGGALGSKRKRTSFDSIDVHYRGELIPDEMVFREGDEDVEEQ